MSLGIPLVRCLHLVLTTTQLSCGQKLKMIGIVGRRYRDTSQRFGIFRSGKERNKRLASHIFLFSNFSLAFSRSGKQLASAGGDNAVVIWEAEGDGEDDSYRMRSTVTGMHERTVYSVDWARVGANLLATGSADNCVRVLTGDSPVTQLAVGSHTADVNCVRWNPRQPNILASCSDDMTVRIWKYVEK